MLKKIKLKIAGIHCASCKTLIETEIDVLAGVKDINVNHKSGEANVEFDEKIITESEIIKQINKLNYQASPLSSNNKKITSIEKKNKKFSFLKKLILASFLLILFIAGYYLIQQAGFLQILAKLNEQNISYSLIFLIGLLASFHCIGMCGGLVVTYSARQIKNNEKNKKTSLPHWQYNAGRLISYTVVGAILGGFGSFFGINPSFSGVVLLIAAIFMVMMGLSLITNFAWLNKIKLKTPDFIAKFLFKNKHKKKPKGPLVIGLLTGFMPCGPLQAMELYALTTGSITKGALSMGIYALGTVPLMFGFGSFISLISQTKIKQMMKISGVVVVILGLFMLNRGLLNFGYGLRSLLPEKSLSQTEYKIKGDIEKYQTVTMDVTYRGYQPNVLYIKKGIPVKWVINGSGITGCTNEIILHGGYNIRKKLTTGENIIEFTPTETGEIKFSCWMQMVWGKFIVTENGELQSNTNLQKQLLDVPAGSACAGNGTCGGTCGQSTCSCGSGININ
ncbi:MAG: sulfite exporter TauE/SafE family protein [Patescibacteria group bacterium]